MDLNGHLNEENDEEMMRHPNSIGIMWNYWGTSAGALKPILSLSK
jgi:hypothetical protein